MWRERNPSSLADRRGEGQRLALPVPGCGFDAVLADFWSATSQVRRRLPNGEVRGREKAGQTQGSAPRCSGHRQRHSKVPCRVWCLPFLCPEILSVARLVREVFAPAALASVREKQAGRTRLVWSANGEPSFPGGARNSVFASRRNLRCRCFWTEVKIRVWAGAAGSKRQALLASGLVAGALLDEKNSRCRESHLDNSRADLESD